MFPFMIIFRRKTPGVVELRCSGQAVCQVSAGLCKSNILPQIFKKEIFFITASQCLTGIFSPGI